MVAETTTIFAKLAVSTLFSFATSLIFSRLFSPTGRLPNKECGKPIEGIAVSRQFPDVN